MGTGGKKLLFALLFVFSICGVSFAQEASEFNWGDIIKSTPSVKTGVFYNINDSKWQIINSVTLAQFKGLSLDVGYANQETFCVSANYDVVKLESIGVQLPILKDIVANVGWTAGFKRLTSSNEFRTGPSATLKYTVKFG